MNFSAAGAIGMALAVMLGAFGAHGLKNRLDAYALGIWEKAVFYHFVHAIGLLVVPLMAKLGYITAPGGTRVCVLLLVGMLLFSGSLYVLALSGMRVLGAVTPLGGVSFIAAWALLAWELLRRA